MELWNPLGPLPLLVENYAPVHLLAHALEWQLFGASTTGYHVVNVLMHVLASCLLVLVFLRTRIPLPWAAAAGALFLVHPANVEAVAWISQLKTTASMALGLGALLCHPRRPGAAALLFALALLAKPTAAVFLPVAVLLGWAEPAADGQRLAAWRWAWLGVWLALFAAFAVLEMWAFSQTAGTAPPVYPDLGVRARSLAANAGRYLVMAATGTGLSAFHEPPPATSWLDPVWLGGLAALLGLGARSVWCLVQRRVEAAYWGWAVVSFLPISGVIPLPHAIADRYLYFILPGLLGAVLLAGREWMPERWATDSRFARAAAIAGLGLGLVFAWSAHARAVLWQSGSRVMADATRNYPQGKAALLLGARRAGLQGDADGALRRLRELTARGYDRLDYLMQEPAFGALRGDPRFQRIVRGLADGLLARLRQSESPSQHELHAMALAYEVRGEREATLRTLERAVELGGPLTDQIRRDLELLRRTP
ncbi:MAG: hypothetical protein MJE66_08805 [Proteobacteria bacterium]|nr:hypothetical protein [Pseudomonadota bacterium]